LNYLEEELDEADDIDEFENGNENEFRFESLNELPPPCFFDEFWSTTFFDEFLSTTFFDEFLSTTFFDEFLSTFLSMFFAEFLSMFFDEF
jgi:hypothetical protein